MLTLERKEGEAISLTIGKTRIRVKIDQTSSTKTEVAIDAPAEVKIECGELEK